ncbi:hypothetical protein C8N24_0286 [Solirubrobacter pauli]|uniref:Uncharacterized protein n=1 Tax=Solirubrobacter pauli TaxID=166793 RepID=A0A660LCR6_9ACTN|nr:hypothetical protein [Solirubrobacter pauli]RKQ90481.1 hypothetical protein C8N24_0286 [Solirubrobacter pauli]
MSENTATTTFKPATARQRQLIADLAAELGREIKVPATAKAASAVIVKTIQERNAAMEALGKKPEPTAAQLRLLEKLGAERGKTYKVPATRAQASARIAQILAAGAVPEGNTTTADAPETEVAAAA